MEEYQLILIFIIIAIIIWRLLPALVKPEFKISGTVKDAAGAPIGGASVTLTNQDTGEVVAGTSGEDGAYAFPNQKAGNYSLDGYKDNGDGSHYAGSIGFSIAGDIVTDLTLEKANRMR